jgi:hypothetical protein
MSFMKEESGGLLKKRWNLVLENWFAETLLLVSHWTRAVFGLRQLALASFYLAKAHITTHNNQLIRPNRRCTDDDFSVVLRCCRPIILRIVQGYFWRT